MLPTAEAVDPVERQASVDTWNATVKYMQAVDRHPVMRYGKVVAFLVAVAGPQSPLTGYALAGVLLGVLALSRPVEGRPGLREAYGRRSR